MRYFDFKKLQKLANLTEEQNLFEVKMTYKNLEKLTKKSGALAGLEFEMIVPNVQVSSDDFDVEAEPDYDYDEGTYNIDQICDFFDDGDFNSRRDINRLRMDLEGDFQTWADNQFDSNWENNKEEFIYEYLVNEVDGEDIAEILGLDPQEVDGFTKDQIYAAAELVLNAKGDLYDLAYDYHRDQFMGEDDLQQQWLDDAGLSNMTDINSSYNIAWPHYRYPDSEPEANMAAIAQSFSQAVGRKVKTSDSYHGSGAARPSKTQSHYIIEPDSSLSVNNFRIVGEDGKNYKLFYATSSGDARIYFKKWLQTAAQKPDFKKQNYELDNYDDDTEKGLEFVSPPIPIPDMIQEINKVQAWAKQNGCTTNSTSGLHMNVSVPNLDNDKLDYVKLALLIGDQYVLEQFGRSANSYCKSAFLKIKEKSKTLDIDQTSDILKQLQTGLNKLASLSLQNTSVSKYTSIHPQNKPARVEFRSPGGDWIDEDPKKLAETLLRFVYGLEAATNPEEAKEEYYKKFYKLINEDNKDEYGSMIDEFARYLSYHKPVDNEQDTDSAEYKSYISAMKDFRKATVSQLQKDNLAKKAKKGKLDPSKKYTWKVMRRQDVGNVNYYSIVIDADTEDEAKKAALQSESTWRMQFLSPDDLVATPIGLATTETGNAYAIQRLRAIGGNETVHNFQAPSRAEADRMASEYLTQRRLDPLDYVVVRQYRSADTQQRETYTIYDTQDRYNIAGIQARTLEDAIQQFQQRIATASGIYSNPERYQLRDRNGQVVYPESSTSTQSEPDSGAPMRYTNPTGRESNPEGQYVIMMSYGDPPLYRFNAANSDDAQAVLHLWQAANPEVEDRMFYDWDPNMLFGQPATPQAIPGSTIDLARRRAAATQSQQRPAASLSDPILLAPLNNPDANWAIVRNSDDAIIEYFTRNTPAEAETAFNRWIESLDADNNIRTNYRLEPVRPRSSASSTRTTDPGDISGWRIILSNGEEVHRGTNTGISQQEAESRAASWLYNNGYGVLSSAAGDYRVEPIRPMSRGQENTRPEPETTNWTARNQLWRILVNDQEVHNFWNTNVQSDANAAATQWILDQIRRGLLSPEEGAEVLVVPVRPSTQQANNA